MTYIPASLRELVTQRANHRCEYCLIHDADTYLPHEVDHIYAEKHGGETVDENLCLSCFYCNRYKGTDLASIDPKSGEIISLFHPRKNIWTDHFKLVGEQIEPQTAHGRVTVRLLRLNETERLLERAVLVALGRYPLD